MTNSTARAVIDVGSVIADTYVIEALLGRGGMGAVFLASHRRLAGKRVAIKILHTEIEDADIVARFKREAEIAARLNHPNIVGVIDYNVAPDGTPYLVLDYLEGETLAQRIARGPMALEHVLSIVRQVGSALAAAHRGGIVHRDLKPQNIFLVPTEVDGRHVEIAKVLDFGISKIRGSQTVKTQDSALLGTPQYMAPEQATGQHANVDERTDIFALGAIVYEMFTGRPAFSGASIPEVVFKVVYEQPASLAQQVPTLPPAITSAVAQAMAKPSDERFPTIAGFVEAVTGQPLTLSRSGASAGATPAADAPSTGRRVAGGDAFAQTMGSGDHGESPVNPLLATAAPGAIAGVSPSAASAHATGSLGAGPLASGTAGARASGAAAALASGTASGPYTPGVASASTPPHIAAAPTVDIPSLRGEPPARRRSKGMIAAIAFVAAAAIGGGVYAVTRPSGPPSTPTANADDRHGNPPAPRASAALPGDHAAGDSKGIPSNPAGDTNVSGSTTGDTKAGDAKAGDSKAADSKAGDAKAGDAKASDSKAGDAKAGDAKAGDSKIGDATAGDTKTGDAKASDSKAVDAKAGDSKAGDSKAGDAKAGDTKTGKPGAKPDPRVKPKNPGAGAGHPDDDVEGDDDARQKLAQAMAALDRHEYDQAERLANAVINAPGSPRQHASARMIHGIVQCAARNDQEAANIDLRSLEKFRNLRGRLLNVCRSHGIFTTR